MTDGMSMARGFPRVARLALAMAVLMFAGKDLTAQVGGQAGGMGQGAMREGMAGMMGMMQGMMGGGMMGPEMMQMMGQGMGMMATGGPSATMVLRMGEPLGLSEEQRAQLQAIQAEGAAAVQMHAEAMMAGHRNAAGALAASPADFAAYERGLREAAEHLVQTHLAMARSAAEARAVLTAEQRERLRSGMQMMQMMKTMMQMMQSPADAPAAGDPAHMH